MERDTEISSKTLFHYTCKNNLKSIIQSGHFKIRYCKESLLFFDDEPESNKEWAIPMICFCDIPLKLVENHISVYGNYAIGLTKEWGTKQGGVNPVFYINKKPSEARTYIKFLLKETVRQLNTKKEQTIEFHNLCSNMIGLIRYGKPYSGDFKKKLIEEENYKFYDEREWRYVIPMYNRAHKPFLVEEQLERIDEINSQMPSNAVISFKSEDIDYIIVESENEIEEYQTIANERWSDFNSEKINTLEYFNSKC